MHRTPVSHADPKLTLSQVPDTPPAVGHSCMPAHCKPGGQSGTKGLGYQWPGLWLLGHLLGPKRSWDVGEG